jgi:hypothetical protein
MAQWSTQSHGHAPTDQRSSAQTRDWSVTRTERSSERGIGVREGITRASTDKPQTTLRNRLRPFASRVRTVVLLQTFWVTCEDEFGVSSSIGWITSTGTPAEDRHVN